MNDCKIAPSMNISLLKLQYSLPTKQKKGKHLGLNILMNRISPMWIVPLYSLVTKWHQTDLYLGGVRHSPDLFCYCLREAIGFISDFWAGASCQTSLASLFYHRTYVVLHVHWWSVELNSSSCNGSLNNVWNQLIRSPYWNRDCADPCTNLC